MAVTIAATMACKPARIQCFLGACHPSEELEVVRSVAGESVTALEKWTHSFPSTRRSLDIRACRMRIYVGCGEYIRMSRGHDLRIGAALG
jgi:hypothetical protein